MKSIIIILLFSIASYKFGRFTMHLEQLSLFIQAKNMLEKTELVVHKIKTGLVHESYFSERHKEK